MPDSEDDYDAWGTWGADAKSAPLTEASASAAEAKSAPKPRLESQASASAADAKSAPLTEASASAACRPAEQEQEVAVPPQSSETMDIEEVSGDWQFAGPHNKGEAESCFRIRPLMGAELKTSDYTIIGMLCDTYNVRAQGRSLVVRTLKDTLFGTLRADDGLLEWSNGEVWRRLKERRRKSSAELEKQCNEKMKEIEKSNEPLQSLLLPILCHRQRAPQVAWQW